MSEEKQRNRFQRVCQKIADFLGKVVKYAIFNPLVFLILGLIVGARMFEGGLMGMEGTTVWVTGACTTADKQERSDLAQDQVLVASISDNTLKGVIRATREFVSCDTKNATFDRLGPLKDWNKGFIDVPTISKVKAQAAPKLNYKQYEKKKLLVSGLCNDATTGKAMDAFSSQVVAVTSTQAIEGSSEDFILLGIREDNKPLACKSTNITYELYVGQGNEIVAAVPATSWKGKKVFVTGTCFPDQRLYKKVGKLAPFSFFNFQKTPVEILEAVTAENDPETLTTFSASILERKEIEGKSIFGVRVVCDQKESPLNVILSSDPSIEVESSTKTAEPKAQ